MDVTKGTPRQSRLRTVGGDPRSVSRLPVNSRSRSPLVSRSPAPPVFSTPTADARRQFTGGRSTLFVGVGRSPGVAAGRRVGLDVADRPTNFANGVTVDPRLGRLLRPLNRLPSPIPAAAGRRALPAKPLTLEDRLRAEVVRLRNEIGALRNDLDKANREISAKVEMEEQHARAMTDLQSRLLLALREHEETKREVRELRLTVRGTMRTAIRVKPIGEGEVEIPAVKAVEGQQTVEVRGVAYHFDHVWSSRSSQKYVFDEVSPLIQSCVDGFNVALIAYGQTGSGKTYTMSGGDGELEGIIPRSLKLLFAEKTRLGGAGWNVSISAFFLEVYMSRFIDLFNNRTQVKPCLDDFVNLTGFTEKPLNSAIEGVALFRDAEKLRATASTSLNMASSRSHSIFVVKVAAENDGTKRTGYLNLVDLAGSERVNELGVQGDRYKEALSINTSLFQLRIVLRELMSKQPHVSIRGNALTKALSSVFNSRTSKTAVIVTVRQDEAAFHESQRSVEFADWASQTEVGIARQRVSKT